MMKPLNKRMYEIWKKLKGIKEVPKEVLEELESVSDDVSFIANPYLPDDLIESGIRYGIQDALYGKRVSILQNFHISYIPDELPKLVIEYTIMNDDYKPHKKEEKEETFATQATTVESVYARLYKHHFKHLAQNHMADDRSRRLATIYAVKNTWKVYNQ